MKLTTDGQAAAIAPQTRKFDGNKMVEPKKRIKEQIRRSQTK